MFFHPSGINRSLGKSIRIRHLGQTDWWSSDDPAEVLSPLDPGGAPEVGDGFDVGAIAKLLFPGLLKISEQYAGSQITKSIEEAKKRTAEAQEAAAKAATDAAKTIVDANKTKILGMEPTTAALVGVGVLGALVGTILIVRS